MALTHRELVAALGKLTQEKQERVDKLTNEEKDKLEQDTAAKKLELEALEQKKKQIDDQAKKEVEELAQLKDSITQEVAAANEEQTVFDLQRRILDFHGSDAGELRERLIKEGYGEQLVNYMLKFRTLEQTIGEPGLQPSFSAWGESKERENPLERIMQGAPRLYDMTDRRVLERLEDLRSQALERGYLSQQEERFVQNVAYFTNKFEENEEYKQKDERGYISRAAEAADSIRRHLGLDMDTGTLSYGGKKL